MRDRSFLRVALFSASALCFGLAASNACARDTDPAPAPDGDTQVAEVIVTAARRETNLQKTPIAITAFGADALKDQKIDSIRDLAGRIPNLNVSRATIGYTTQTFFIRGIGEADPIQEPVLAVYVDDVYLPRQLGSMLDLNDVKQIEVLRGPQGTLYGRNSSGGALRVTTRDPDGTLHEVAELGLGDYGAVNARALVSGPIVKDDLYGSLSYTHHSRDGVTQDPTLGHDVNRIDLDQFRAKLRWTPNEKTDVLLTADYLHDTSDTRSYIPVNQPGGFDPQRSFSEVEPLSDLDQGGVSLRTSYALADHLKLKYIAAYRGFNLNPVDYENDGTAALIQRNLIHYNDQYWTQELQLTGDYGPLTYTGGFFYIHERFFVHRDGYSRTGPLTTSPISALEAHNVTNTDSYALYGEANWKATDRLTLTAGLRGTMETKTFTFDNNVLNLDGTVKAPSIAGQADKTWDALTPKAVASWQFTPLILGYVSYSQGFKSGGFDNRATRLDLAELPFSPERVSTYEVGEKGEFFGRRLRANVSGFYNDYNNLQVSFYDPQYVGTRRGNAGQAHTYGVEVEADAKPVSRLTLFGNVGWLYAVYDDFKGAGGPGVNADGNRLTNAPRWSGALGAAYDLPLQLPGTWRLETDAQYQDFIYSTALNRPLDKAPSQIYLNAQGIWTAPGGRWSLSLSAKNLLDTQKPIATGYTPSVGIDYDIIPDPRTFLVTLRYEL